MPFLKFSRDKRGYEHTYLVHDRTRRGKPSRPRVLYWYRTPPGIRVGRQPFDDEIRRRLEAQNPDVTFDWPTIIATPIPPPAENEQWRERRRAERAAKQAQRVEEVSAERQESVAPEADSVPRGNIGEPRAEFSEGADEPCAERPGPPPAGEAALTSEHVAPEAAPGQATPDAARRRRRRGGRRRRGRLPGSPENPMASPSEGASNEPSTDADVTKTFEPNDE